LRSELVRVAQLIACCGEIGGVSRRVSISADGSGHRMLLPRRQGQPETTYDNFTPDFGERFVLGTTRGPTPDIALATVVRRRGSPRLGWPVHAWGEAGVDLCGIERRDGFGRGKGYGRTVLIADPRHPLARW
jgi:hypothetical protein